MRGEKSEGYYWNLVFWISLSNCDGNEIKQHNNRVCAQSCPTLCNPWTVARQAPLFMGFSRQEYWSGLPFPPLGNLPDPGIEPTSLVSPALAGNSLPLCCLGSPMRLKSTVKCVCIMNRLSDWTELNWTTPWKESYDQPRQHIEKQRYYFVNKGPSSQGYGFSSGHVWMWELDCEESWVPKNWCFWTVVLEKTLESPLDCKKIQPVHSKGDQSWVFFGRTDAKAETPILWPPHAKSWLTGKDSDAGRDWGHEEKGMTEDEMAGWHHRLDGHEFG